MRKCLYGPENGQETAKSLLCKALTKFRLDNRFDENTKLKDLGMSVHQLRIFLHTAEGLNRVGLGCPLKIDEIGDWTVGELELNLKHK